MVHPKHNSFRCFLLSLTLPPALHSEKNAPTTYLLHIPVAPPMPPPQRLSARVARTLYMLPLPPTKRRAR
ncbi:unnamed protein product, partial [Ectocarpus sp. 8 AP-2014]